MAKPVVVLEEGGIPCVNVPSVTSGAMPMTAVSPQEGGTPITLVDDNGMPITLIDEQGVLQIGDAVINSVTITGSGFIGAEHTAVVDYAPTSATIVIQWYMDGVAISDADGTTFVPEFAVSTPGLTFKAFLEDLELESDPLVITEAPPDAPVVTAAGTITSESSLGKIGYAQTVTGCTYTGDGVTLTAAWERDGTPITDATSFSYIPVAADDGTDLTRVTTATNVTDSDSDETPAQAITYEAPVALSSGVWAEEEDTGDQTFDATALFSIFADAAFDGASWSIVSGVASASVDASGIVTITTANALTGTITVRCTNSGGSADNTIALTVTAPPIVAPTINAISDQTLAIHATTQTTITASASAGTAPITWSLTPAVVKPVIDATVAPLYGFNREYGANEDATVTLEQQWVVDGVDASGQTGLSFDNTTPAYGDGATADLTVKFRINGGAWVESDAVSITGADLGGDPPVLVPTILDSGRSGSNPQITSMNVTYGAYVPGNVVLQLVTTGHNATTRPHTFPTVPDSATRVTICQNVDDAQPTNTNKTCVSVIAWKALGTDADGGTLAWTIPAADQWECSYMVLDGINGDDILEAVVEFDSNNADVETTTPNPIVTPTLLVPNAGCIVFAVIGTNLDDVDQIPAGWTLVQGNDIGGCAQVVCRRDALTTQNETVAAANFGIAAAARYYAGAVFALNPAAPDWSAYNSPSDVEPTLVVDVENEVYLRDLGTGNGLEEVTLAALFNGTGGTTPSIVNEGGVDGIDVGTGILPRIALDGWWNATEGTVVIEWRFTAFAQGTFLFHINDGSNNTCIRPYSDGTNLKYLVRIGGATQGSNITAAAITVDAVQKAAFAMKAADFAVSANGAAVVANAAGAMPTGLGIFNLAHNNGTSLQPTGIVTKLIYYPERIVNADLVTMSGA